MHPSHPLFPEFERQWAEHRRRNPYDPAKVQAQLKAWLTEHGRAVADGLGLGLDLDLAMVNDGQLERLGRVDAIAQHPDLDQDLAVRLAWIADTRHQDLALAQHERDHELGQAHDHGRLRETGVDLDQDHARLGLAIDHEPTPDPGTTDTPDIRGSRPPTGPRRGRGDSAARGGPETQADKAPITDEVKWYLENVPDPDDEEWS